MVKTMKIKEICKIWTDRTTCCSVCHRPHYIANYKTLPENIKKKLKPFSCALPIHPKDLKHGCRGYCGSYVKEGYTIDVFDFDVNSRTYVIDLFKRSKKEKEEDSLEEIIEESWEAIFQYEDEESEGLY